MYLNLIFEAYRNFAFKLKQNVPYFTYRFFLRLKTCILRTSTNATCRCIFFKAYRNYVTYFGLKFERTVPSCMGGDNRQLH